MEKFHTGAGRNDVSPRRGFVVAPSSARSMEQEAGSSTPAPGPNTLPFGTPGATDVAQVLRFVASPLVRAAALPAPTSVGVEGDNRVCQLSSNSLILHSL
jgi:hypothetical protein